MSEYKIFAINPGSTSTKIALFTGDKCIFSKSVSHDAKELEKFHELHEQLGYRRETILSLLKDSGITIDDVDVFVGRGGGLFATEGGTYEVTPVLLDHARRCANGVVHPAGLGPQLAHEFASLYNARAMVVNPPDVDELQDIARITGICGVNRTVHLHSLNLKETAIRHSEQVEHKKYQDCCYVVCHIGGGISVSAHKNGRMIDGCDIVGGEGPMAPTRCGAVPVSGLIRYAEKTGASIADLKKLCTKTGGFVSHLGISDALETENRAHAGDYHAKMVWEGMMYQIEKQIGAMAAVLHGKVDAILLGGGIARDRELVDNIKDACSFIAPVYAYPGEFEMEAMAAGAIRVLEGSEELKVYSGHPVWDGFPWDKE